MKKIALLLTVFIGLTALQSCTIDEYYDETSQVFEMTDDIELPEYNYTNLATWQFQPAIYHSDNVLDYRWNINSWSLLPTTYELNATAEQISCNYDFTRY